MDPLSQGALGAAAAQAVAQHRALPWAALLGGLSGMAPDLDVLVRSSRDPLLFLEYHRQFSHSLVFIPVGALLCAILLFPLARQRLDFPRAYLYCLVGYGTHGLLDACTSYGTQLLWPFSSLRVAWNMVSVVDPIFTLPLLALTLAAAFRRRPALARLGCVWAALYLALGLAQRERVESAGAEVARERGHAPVQVEAKPSFGNLLLWKTYYEYGDAYYVDAMRAGLRTRSLPGESTSKLDLERDLPWLERDTQQARDLERFRWYSSGFVALDPARRDRVIDVRYSMLPTRIQALWGIVLDADAEQDAHAEFFTERRASRAQRDQLRRMLLD